MSTPFVPPCQECGACCHGESDAHVVVTRDDERRLGARRDELTWVEAGHRYMRMRIGHCVALRRENGLFTCSIYALRPAVCRDLERGSSHCLDDRAAFGA